MKVCFPVQADAALESRIYNHFGSAPFFVVVDTETSETTTVRNQDQHHAHGACNPVRALGEQEVDAVIVGGIGGGALNRLNQLGVRVYQAGEGGIREQLALLQAGGLAEYTLRNCCGGHGRGDGCPH
ncbi:MAG: NifB/NifX family molybdenum-iron cluster-binding protein [Thermodesulfovibrionales bacterium]